MSITKLNQMGENSLRAIKEDGSIINLADIQGATLRPGSLVGKITLTASATALRVGSADLTSRHSLTVINDSSILAFIGFDSAVTTSTGFLLNSGTGITFDFDPNDPVTIYGLTSELQTSITLIEVK